MTGTADTEASEFHEIYKLDVVQIPTNLPMQRIDSDDVVYKNERGKFKAVIDEITERNAKGQPILVGTVSVEKSEVLSSMLKRKNIPHTVLNASQNGPWACYSRIHAKDLSCHESQHRWPSGSGRFRSHARCTSERCPSDQWAGPAGDRWHDGKSIAGADRSAVGSEALGTFASGRRRAE